MRRSRRSLLILVLLSALILAACDGGEEPTSTPAPTATPEPTEAVVEETEEITEEPTEEPEVTEEATEEMVEETEEPTEEATEEAMAEETEEATEEAMAEETEEAAVATIEPTEVVEETEEAMTVVEEAAESDFTILVEAIAAAGLEEALSETGPFTIFAPTNAAFESAFESMDVTAEEFLADTERLSEILQYHVVEGEVLAEDLAEMDGDTLATLLADAEISVSLGADDEVILNDSVDVIMADVGASNGVIHVINSVLLPPETMDTAEEMTGEAAEEATEEAMVEETEEAAEMEAEATEEMVEAEETPEAVTEAMEGDFTLLLSFIEAVGLDDELSEEDEAFTIFAPTDESFEAALTQMGLTVEELESDTEQLERIVRYHIVGREIPAQDLAYLNNFHVLTMLPDAVVDVDVTEDDTIVLNETANVIQADIRAANGVIHIIDEVLIPPSEVMAEEEESE